MDMYCQTELKKYNIYLNFSCLYVLMNELACDLLIWDRQY